MSNWKVIPATRGDVLDYEQASRIGIAGEGRVSDSLRSMSATLEYRLIDNLLLMDDRVTAQIDHVLVDRFGILVIETKNYHALIKGQSDDKFWTACYSGKGRRRERFLNPLDQNDRHREILHRVLGAFGTNLPASYMQNLVVFAGGNIDHLDLGTDALRVVPEREMVDYLRARCGDFPPNPGALDAEQISELLSRLTSANQANNPEVIALHAENVGRATRRFGDRFRTGRPAPTTLSPTSPYGAPTIYHRGARYPDGSPIEAARPKPVWKSMFRQVFGVAFVLAVGWWLLLGPGPETLPKVSTYLTAVAGFGVPATPALSPPAVTPLAATHDVNLALLRLTEASPSVAQRLSNPTEPALSLTGGMPTYTWDYVVQSAQNTASIAHISITLDASGRIVGVTGGS